MARLVKLASLSEEFQVLARAAVAASAQAYAAYSEFHVGAALLHFDGTHTVGCNWENCTFQATCAERCAIVAANANGKRQAKAVAVYGKSRKAGVVTPPMALTPPCGLCRQFLHEVAELSSVDMTVILVTASEDSAEVMKLSDLLPLAFGPTSCSLDISKYVPKEN